MGAFPELATPRLRLREMIEADTAAYRALLHFPQVVRHTNLVVAPDEMQTLKSMRWMRELWPAGNGCAWVIEEAASGAFVGAVRFNYFFKGSRCGASATKRIRRSGAAA